MADLEELTLNASPLTAVQIHAGAIWKRKWWVGAVHEILNLLFGSSISHMVKTVSSDGADLNSSGCELCVCGFFQGHVAVYCWET